ncbi:MAG: riboflavin biosynthesis protein RibF [Clostridiales bacterium]|nr:riboflavin biosynthesis protein RibF [Clostridiales bacterium]
MLLSEYFSLEGSSVALGNFDGLHAGHLKVIKSAAEGAKDGLRPVVLLFDRHPLELVSGNAPARLLTVQTENDILARMGVTPVIAPFGELMSMSGEEFFSRVLVDTLHAERLSCGENYRFGANASGNVQTLRALCERFCVELNVIELENYAGEPVSSTRIRKALSDGDIKSANSMLSEPFSYDFTVVSGDRRGRLLGAPTINQHFPEGFIVPRFGVYASRAFVNGKWHASVTNIGIRPTIGHGDYRSETCIMDFSGNLYGKNIRVALLEFLRPEMKFASLDELSARIKQDAETARRIFDEN